MMLEQYEIIPFEDVVDIMSYINKMLAEKVSRADFAERIRSQTLRSFRTKSVLEKKIEREEKNNNVNSFNLLA